MSIITNYPLNAEQQNALLELISYAMHAAECAMDSMCRDDQYKAELGWISQEDLGWLKALPGVLTVLDGTGEEVLIAQDLIARLNRLKPMSEGDAG